VVLITEKSQKKISMVSEESDHRTKQDDMHAVMQKETEHAWVFPFCTSFPLCILISC
jgi:hypothetical protein